MLGRVIVTSLVGAVFALSVQFANAQTPGGGAPPSVVAAFQANPSQLLTQFPNGGPDMTSQVRALITADRTTLSTIISLARNANQDQRKALAQALADTAKQAAANDPAFANQIQQAVATSGISEFAKAYAEAAGDTGTASTGGGGGGGGPNVPGAPTGGPNTGGFPGGNSVVANGFTNLLTGGSLGGAGGTSTTTTITTNQVSSF
jgi:hypothetical protein